MKIKSNRYKLTKEEYIFTFLGVEVNTDERTGKVTLPQKGLMKKLKIDYQLENYNYKFNPEGLAPLSHDIHGIQFEEDWEYKTKVVIGIQFVVNQCERFTHYTKKIHAMGMKRI